MEKSLKCRQASTLHRQRCRKDALRLMPITLKLVALLLILNLGAACNNSRQSRPANLASTAGTPIASPALDAASQTVADMKVSAIDLTAAYVSDAAAADKLYKGRLLEISGQVESILLDGPPPVGSLKDLSGQTLMFFRGQTVACVFAPEQKGAAAQLRSRQRVTVVGRCDGRYDSRVILRDCQMIAPHSNTSDVGARVDNALPAEE